ncbi:YueI family protein [Bacillus sp. FJAT-49736]|uniref:YueI family protein n=1 Tax=Bacillus sp. FJAT-49736 TaxID=2833582 RepID=UPI001BC99749|nr:YueI family protein [Bacillus sp. FJAT-49736]MBS4173388.1 YueI family protein [Bacillus sp. FJAT-49736]
MRNGPSLDDYLEKGLYGEKQIKPAEKKKYLGTYRERIIVALTKSQVMEKSVYPEVEDFIKTNPDANLLVNGDLLYSAISKYLQIAKKYGNNFSIVTNHTNSTNIGLVLAHSYAIDKENIYIQKSKAIPKKENKKKRGLWSSLKGRMKKKH